LLRHPFPALTEQRIAQAKPSAAAKTFLERLK
jgi:hypothetical protein